MWNPFKGKTMTDKPEEKKKNILQKMKEGVDDKEEQLAALSTLVRLGILIWSGGILTLAYIKLPPAFGIPEQKLDPTFIASVFTGTLATFGVAAAKKNGDKNGNAGVSKGDLEALIQKAAEVKPHQTVTIEHNPIVLKTTENKYEL
jgi:hypothetical protein